MPKHITQLIAGNLLSGVLGCTTGWLLCGRGQAQFAWWCSSSNVKSSCDTNREAGVCDGGWSKMMNEMALAFMDMKANDIERRRVKPWRVRWMVRGVLQICTMPDRRWRCRSSLICEHVCLFLVSRHDVEMRCSVATGLRCNGTQTSPIFLINFLRLFYYYFPMMSNKKTTVERIRVVVIIASVDWENDWDESVWRTPSRRSTIRASQVGLQFVYNYLDNRVIDQSNKNQRGVKLIVQGRGLRWLIGTSEA